ncbi:DNA-binding transcriptional regulator, Lrp family [Micromonospora phaseoli]|uniref:DNA-binding transcriptional regulator, Lrp family n=1 Tax=Micromonospora phaseoli TaxID=1144548 RepID=A0A1H7DGR8_9ACTN|nr:Lrp/AsnC family transcriptional regulator [Micromonospora phaseoli]PZV90908.1 AsnC family transcriptional regulator [Micromonospora phaseoli]GIJ77422.1 putative transcriptional regulator, AsnC family protein [Micromonospora phaseoli]SEJ98440.1 DNA-binding transcriptional regulator, Lrp family [Micromonospora phaseoli]
MPPVSNDVRPFTALDDTDRAILTELAVDGRLANNALAERVGVAPSTCLARTRALRECGAIRGFHAEVDPAAVGLPLQALVSVRLTEHARAAVDAFRTRSVRLPGVVSVFHVAGADDYVLHVRAASAEALRDFVLDHLAVDPAVQHTQTSLIFEQARGMG